MSELVCTAQGFFSGIHMTFKTLLGRYFTCLAVLSVWY